MSLTWAGTVPGMTRTRHLAALAVVAALAGCGSDPEPAAAPPTPSASSAAPLPSPASPIPSPTPEALLPFGKGIRTGGGYVTATVYGYRHNIAKSAPRPDGHPGYVWAAADVKVCANKDITEPWVGVSNGPWVLRYADDTQIGPSQTGYEAFPKPEYPWTEKKLTPGRCVRGWITFPAPGSKRPVAVEYAPEVESDTPRWAVK